MLSLALDNTRHEGRHDGLLHTLLGEDRPLNVILLKEPGPVWEAVSERILRNIKNEEDKKQAALLTNRIDAAFTQARNNFAHKRPRTDQNEAAFIKAHRMCSRQQTHEASV